MGEHQRILNDAERRDWLRLYRSENVGPATFFRLLDRFGTPAKALERLPGMARQGGRGRPLRIASAPEAERELEAIDRLGARLIASVEGAFPKLLKPLDTAPLLIARGNIEFLQRDGLAIVGARNASALGRRMARELAIGLGSAGLTVISGMARGIDTAAHEGAMATGTIAVLAGGVDVVYPQENRGLYERLREQGCVISELKPGTVPQAAHFPRRNRLVSGLSRGVVVVEAALKSGSLITARFALEQGRDVFAVPGSPFDPRCQGTNGLIKEGAALVESAADVLDAIMPSPGACHPRAVAQSPPERPLPAEDDLSRAREIVIPALSPSPVTVDEIVRQCQLSPAAISMVLIELELAGRLERHPDNQVSLLP